MAVVYMGENLFAGFIGKTFIIMAFITALTTLIFYLLQRGSLVKGAINMPRTLFYSHAFCVIGAVSMLLFLIFDHHFEYLYVWKYTSLKLSSTMLFSSLWTGQEGSYLLWLLFQAFIGLFIMHTSGKYERYAMMVIAVSQLMLTSMVLGWHFGDVIIGESPFELLRNSAIAANNAFFSQPDYLLKLMDGNGMNPLLENPWMVIHPPVLFLGYAVSLAPFSLAIAALAQRDFSSWLPLAIRWMIFAMFTLGAGILLGGRWAYESLTFGGFWAWDPVENASLVPWLIMVAALHVLVIADKRRRAILWAFGFSLAVYIAVIYAAFLTRSGILGETSVHAFGKDSRMGQLIMFLLTFVAGALVLLGLRRKEFIVSQSNKLVLRELWMFFGALILLLSAFQIILTTSVPVLNSMFGTTIAPPIHPEKYYNQWQMPYVILVMLMIGVSQMLSYRHISTRILRRYFAVMISVALFMSVITIEYFSLANIELFILVFSCWVVIVSSVIYAVQFLYRATNSGGVIAHIGFAVFILGVVVTFTNSSVISRDKHSRGHTLHNGDNMLVVKDAYTVLGEFVVCYRGQYTQGSNTYYTLDFYNRLSDTLASPWFTVNPSINRNKRFGDVFNPDTRHLFAKDVFTYISFAEDPARINEDGYVLIEEHKVKLEDTISMAGYDIHFCDLRVEMKDEDYSNVDIVAGLNIMQKDHQDTVVQVNYRIENDSVRHDDAIVENVLFRFERVSNKKETIVAGIYEKPVDYIVLKAMIFPNIIIMWCGSFILGIGLLLSLKQNIQRKRK